jgi:UDP-N-acetylglucosamine:LPS N-acetylglucosamine transferase
MSKRILMTYLSAGLGHLVLAQAIAHYVQQMRPSWDIRIMDAARDLDDAVMKKTFEDLWRVFLKMPGFVSQFLFALERLAPRLVGSLNRRGFRTAVPKAAQYLNDYKPDLIMSTHWACSHLFAMAREKEHPPLFYIYGELGATYGVINCGADVYFTLTQRIEDGLRRIGVAEEKMRRIPMVVHPHLLANGAPREVFKKRLGVAENDLLAILSLGGEGIGHSLRFVEAFARDVKDATLIVLTGRNDDLLAELKRRVSSPKVVPMGYQEDISGIVAAADVLAGKCGTGYAMMAMKKGIPLIVTHIGAPNEKENMHYIVDNGYGWFCPRPRQFVQRIELLAQDRVSCRDVLEKLQHVGPQNGAEAIAAAIVSSLG